MLMLLISIDRSRSFASLPSLAHTYPSIYPTNLAHYFLPFLPLTPTTLERARDRLT